MSNGDDTGRHSPVAAAALRTDPDSGETTARLRLSAGRITAESLDAVALAAEEFGDGRLEITGRAELRVRGLDGAATARFVDALTASAPALLAAAGPRPTVLVSPMSGRAGRWAGPELWEAVDRFDALLAAGGPEELLVGLDDGRGDVLAHRPDMAAVAGADGRAELYVSGTATGRVLALQRLPEVLHRITAALPPQLRAAERIEHLHKAVAGLGEAGRVPAAGMSDRDDEPAPRVGWFDQHDGRVLLGAVPESGTLTSEQARFAAAAAAPRGDGPAAGGVIVTPEGELLIPDLSEAVAETVVRVLAPRGFIFDAARVPPREV